MEELDLDRSVEMKEILDNIPCLVTQEKNELLLRPIEMVELEEAVKQLKNEKASDPDGFTTNFFHPCWHIIKEEVLAIVEDSKKIGKILKKMELSLQVGFDVFPFAMLISKSLQNP